MAHESEPGHRTEIDVLDWAGLGRFLLEADRVQYVLLTGSAALSLASEAPADVVALERPGWFRRLVAPSDTRLFRRSPKVVEALAPILEAQKSQVVHFELLDADRNALAVAYDWDVQAGPVTLYGAMRELSESIAEHGLAVPHQVDE